MRIGVFTSMMAWIPGVLAELSISICGRAVLPRRQYDYAAISPYAVLTQDKTFVRKIKEVLLAVALEEKYSKERSYPCI